MAPPDQAATMRPYPTDPKPNDLARGSSLTRTPPTPITRIGNAIPTLRSMGSAQTNVAPAIRPGDPELSASRSWKVALIFQTRAAETRNETAFRTNTDCAPAIATMPPPMSGPVKFPTVLVAVMVPFAQAILDGSTRFGIAPVEADGKGASAAAASAARPTSAPGLETNAIVAKTTAAARSAATMTSCRSNRRNGGPALRAAR